jgi:uncharacterized protein (TIRG00374 family)
MQSLKPKWKGLLKCLGPLLFIFFVIQLVDLRTTAGLIKEIKPGWAAISMLLAPILLATLTLRWWLICQRLEIKIPIKELFQINYISWFIGLLPLMAITPLSKFIYLNEKGTPAGTTAVSITLDKLFDVIGLILFGFFGLIYFPSGLFKEMHVWIFLTVGFLAFVAILVFWNKLWAAFIRFLKRYTGKKIQKIGENLDVDLSGFWSRFDLTFFMFMIFISIGLGILRALILYLLAVSLKIYVSFGLIVACRALIGIVNIIPITINGLGTRDAVLLLALPLAGVSKEAAIALSCLMFLWLIFSKFSGIFFWLNRPLTAKIFTSKKSVRNNNDTAP